MQLTLCMEHILTYIFSSKKSVSESVLNPQQLMLKIVHTSNICAVGRYKGKIFDLRSRTDDGGVGELEYAIMRHPLF